MCAASARQSCCARYHAVATASSGCWNLVFLEGARFLELPGRTSRPISFTFSLTSLRTRLTIVDSCACWRASSGNGYPSALRLASGNGRSERENEADAEQPELNREPTCVDIPEEGANIV